MQLDNDRLGFIKGLDYGIAGMAERAADFAREHIKDEEDRAAMIAYFVGFSREANRRIKEEDYA